MKNVCWKMKSLGLGFAALEILASGAQIQAQQPRQTPSTISDLATENLGKVSASATQIQAVLQQQPGLLVELKRWVAQEAASNGQVIKEGDLADQKIFSRLASDAQFRSIATRLLERYGYLVPKFNPDSDAAEERKLVLQTRANQLALQQNQQVEAQIRQADRLAGPPYAQTNACEPNEPQDGQERQLPNPALEQLREAQTNSPYPGQNCQQVSPRPGASQDRQDRNILTTEQGLARTGQTRTSAALDRDEEDVLISPAAGPSTDGQVVTTALATPQSRSLAGDVLNPFGNNQGNLPGTSANSANAVGGSESSYSDGRLPASGQENIADSNPAGGRYSSRRDARRDIAGENLNPLLVRTRNPYSDIPSLYDMYQQGSPRTPQLVRFGLSVFRDNQRTTRTGDSLPMDLPVGPDYVLGPGDGVTINLWGSSSRRLFRTVDPEGRLSLPEAGPVLVSGRTLGQVQDAVQQILRTQFRDVSADVSLSRLRTIRVYVVGDVQRPGAYDISSLSTPLNALFAAGGPTLGGSCRIARHFHGKQLVEEVDLYDLLLHGVRSDMLRLESGDTVLVPPLDGEVTIEGMVRRPAVYELHGEKSLADMLQLSGGVLPTATLTHIEVQRLVTHEKHTMLSLDLPESGSEMAEAVKKLGEFAIQPGDTVHVFPIAPFNKDAVYLEGHVLRPGKFSYHEGMKLTELVSAYSDLLPEPATRYAEIIRLNPPDYHPTVEGFDLAASLENPQAAPKLEPLDTVRIFGRYDFQAVPKVTVLGEVRSPGTYRTSGQIHLRDAIQLAGGLGPDAEMDNAQVFQYITNSELKITTVNLSSAIAGDPIDNILLGPRDRIVVHRNAAKADLATVLVTGEVLRPGRYPLTNNLRVGDLIRLSGGLKRSADTQNVDLTSYSSAGNHLVGEHQTIDAAAALAGEASADRPLREGDVVSVPEIAGWADRGASIELRGEVKGPGTYGIKPGDHLSTVLKLAGGFQSDAYPYGAILERVSVRELEARNRAELVQRLQNIQSELKAKEESDPRKRKAADAAYQQWQVALDNLTAYPPTGRLTIRISKDIHHWANTASDIEVREGDVLIIPKRPAQVMVTGQVYNSTAVGYRPNKTAKWYLSQAGGPTKLADKGAAFVIRADGSVISPNSGGSMWVGHPMGSVLQAGDMVVVPEKAIGGGVDWSVILQGATLASSIAYTTILAAK